MFLESMIRSLGRHQNFKMSGGVSVDNKDFIDFDTRNIPTSCEIYKLVVDMPDSVIINVRLNPNMVEAPASGKATLDGRDVWSLEFYSGNYISKKKRDALLEMYSNVQSLDFEFISVDAVIHEGVKLSPKHFDFNNFKQGDLIGTKPFGTLVGGESVEFIRREDGRVIADAFRDATTVLLPYGGLYQVGSDPDLMEQTYVIFKASSSNPVSFVTNTDVKRETAGKIDLMKNLDSDKFHIAFYETISMEQRMSVGEFIKCGGLSFIISGDQPTAYESDKFLQEENNELIKVIFNKKRRENV